VGSPLDGWPKTPSGEGGFRIVSGGLNLKGMSVPVGSRDKILKTGSFRESLDGLTWGKKKKKIGGAEKITFVKNEKRGPFQVGKKALLRGEKDM